MRKAYGSISDLRKYYASFELKITTISKVIMALNRRFAENLCFLLRKYYASSDSQLKSLMKQDFACAADAKQAAEKLSRNLKYHCLELVEIKQIPHYNKAGRPTKNQSPEHFTYRVTAQVIPVDSVIEITQRQAGKFILATNVLEEEILPNDEVLTEYKGQQIYEGGFRFLKDPLFYCECLFEYPSASGSPGNGYGLMSFGLHSRSTSIKTSLGSLPRNYS